MLAELEDLREKHEVVANDIKKIKIISCKETMEVR